MPAPVKIYGAQSAWTPYAELNEVLAKFSGKLKELLGGNLIALYLQGSFALGEFDDVSDVDFMVVLHGDISADNIAPFNHLHAQLYKLPTRWGQHLEGSYAPAPVLRKLSSEPRDPPGENRPEDWKDPEAWRTAPFAYPFWFLSNGSARLQRSEHDNAEVTRWVLRERGIAVLGPDPKELIDPVTPDQLRQEIASMVTTVVNQVTKDPDWLASPSGQSSGVLLFARALHTFEVGEVRSKRNAVAFARDFLPPRWAKLVADAFTNRSYFEREPPTNEPNAESKGPSPLAETLAFGHFAAERVRPWLSAQRSKTTRPK